MAKRIKKIVEPIDSKVIFVDIEFLKSVNDCIESLKNIDKYDIEDKALIFASCDMLEEQIDELISGFEK